MSLEGISQIFHFSHVGVQNRLSNSFLNSSNFLQSVDTGKEVIIVDVQKLHGSCGMEIFLDSCIAVHLIDRTLSHKVVPVVETIMLNIVTKGSRNKSKNISIVKLSKFNQTLVFKDEVTVLGHIRSMKIVVVLH